VPIDPATSVVALDTLLAGLHASTAPDFEVLLLALNLLDDIAIACREIGLSTAFGGISSRLVLYDVVFSQTGAGEIIEVPVQPLSGADRRGLIEWLNLGAEMVRMATVHGLN